MNYYLRNIQLPITVNIFLYFISITGVAQTYHELTPVNTVIEGEAVKEFTINNQGGARFYKGKLKAGTLYSIRVQNVNRLVYSGTLDEYKATSRFKSPPEIFSALKLPGFFHTNKETVVFKDLNSDQTYIQTNPMVIVTETAPICECKDPKEILNESTSYVVYKNQLDILKSNGLAFASLYLFKYELDVLSENVFDPWETIQQRKAMIIRKYIHRDIETERDHQRAIEMYYRNIIRRSSEALLEAKKTANSLIEILSTSIPECNIAELKRKLSCEKPCKPNAGLVNAISTYETCVELYKEWINGFKEDIEKADAVVKEMIDQDKEGKILELQTTSGLITAANFSYVVDFFKAKDDVHEVLFSIQSENPLPYGALQKKTITFKGYTTGWKFDFSTGIFFNFGNNTFLGPDYYYEKVNDDTSIIREEVPSKKLMVSIGALGHLYYRFYAIPINIGFSGGVSTTPDFETVNLHLGVSFLFGSIGQDKRFILTPGITWRETSLLNKRYQLNVRTANLPDDVPVSKNLKPGWFIALTYNFPSGK